MWRPNQQTARNPNPFLIESFMNCVKDIKTKSKRKLIRSCTNHELSFPAACLHGICWFGFFNSSPATKKYAVCLKNKIIVDVSCYHMQPFSMKFYFNFLSQKINLKKFIILIFESSSISGVVSNACCM